MTARLQSVCFRALVLGLLTLIAWIGSDLFLLQVEAALGEGGAPAGAAAKAHEPEAAAEPDLDRVVRRNIFNSAAKAEPAAVAASAEPNEPVAVSGLNLVLRGTWIGEPTRTRPDQRSWAIIEDPAANTQAIYEEGDALPGGEAEVVEILPRGVKIRRGGQLELLGFPAVAAPSTAGTAGGYPAPRGGGSEEVRQLAPNRYEIGQRLIDHTMSNLTSVLTQARAIPVEGEGFRLRSIKKGSIFEKVGLQNGDLLRSVNGIQLTSLEQAMKAFKLLQKETRLWVDVTRGDAPQRLDYEIR